MHSRLLPLRKPNNNFIIIYNNLATVNKLANKPLKKSAETDEQKRLRPSFSRFS